MDLKALKITSAYRSGHQAFDFAGNMVLVPDSRAKITSGVFKRTNARKSYDSDYVQISIRNFTFMILHSRARSGRVYSYVDTNFKEWAKLKRLYDEKFMNSPQFMAKHMHISHMAVRDDYYGTLFIPGKWIIENPFPGKTVSKVIKGWFPHLLKVKRWIQSLKKTEGKWAEDQGIKRLYGIRYESVKSFKRILKLSTVEAWCCILAGLLTRYATWDVDEIDSLFLSGKRGLIRPGRRQHYGKD